MEHHPFEVSFCLQSDRTFSSLKVRPLGRPWVRESLAGAAAFPRVTKALMGELFQKITEMRV